MKLVVKVVVGLVVVVVMGCIGTEAITCSPDCTGKDFGDKVPDPKNCTAFYYCLGDGIVTEEPIFCDSGYYFDTEIADCEEELTPCVPLCPSGNPGCHLTCNGSLDFISDIRNCSSFYFCMAGIAEGPFTCSPDHPHFNGHECADNPGACCSEICEPYCEEGAKTAPDPKNCKMFYFCTGEAGEPDGNLHFTCPNGWNFDVHLGECSAEAVCEILCHE